MKRLDLLFQLYRITRSLSRRKGWKDLDSYPNQDYTIWAIVRLYLAVVWMGWTRNLFYEKLKLDGRTLRRHLRLPSALPSYSQLKKRMRRRAFVEALVAVLSESASRVLRALGSQEVRVVMMDLTEVLSTKHDRHARLGTSDGRNWYWGYKLGIFASRSGVVLGAALVPANKVAQHVSARLIRMGSSTVRMSFGEVEVKYLLADSEFAGERIYRQAHRYLRCRLVEPPRKEKDPGRQGPSQMEYQMKRRSPHRYRDWRFWKTPTAKRIYRLRDEIDRRLSQLTDTPFHVDRHPRGTVGVGPILRYELAVLSFWNIALADNIANGRKLRVVKAYAA